MLLVILPVQLIFSHQAAAVAQADSNLLALPESYVVTLLYTTAVSI
jgi:hypothetical protein